MIAIKDAKWEVRIYAIRKNLVWWEAHAKRRKGIGYDMAMRGYLKTKSGCKRNWERFAKLNGIKNWTYV